MRCDSKVEVVSMNRNHIICSNTSYDYRDMSTIVSLYTILTHPA